MVDIPLGLRRAFETQDCVLFVGAGVGCYFKTPQGKCAPNGRELCKSLSDHFGVDFQGNCNLPQVSEIVELRKGRKELETFIHKQLCDLSPDQTFRWITSIRWKAIYTTNYDNCIERAYKLTPKPIQNPVSFSITSDVRSFQPIIDVPIYHIHGYFFSDQNPNIIVTRSDYAKFKERRRMLFESLKRELATSTFLYIGYGNADPNWETLLEETLQEFFPSTLPQSYRVDPFADPLDVEILQSKNIMTLKCPFDEFVSSVSTFTDSLDTAPDVLSNLKKQVPLDLQPNFESAPIPLSRLLASWEYVNQAQFNETSNLFSFLKGDSPNWALIANSEYFERDIQGDIYDVLLDFATSSKTSPSVCILLGPAGYGVSTLLKVFSIQIVKESAGAVFKLRIGASVLEGDIEFASSLFPNVFFVVDDAADFAFDLERCVHLLRESKKRAMFLLGDRLNEWHQRPNRPRGQEFLIEPLSDNEINRLLDFLTKFNSLNKLENFPRDIQFSVVKERHKKELLVTMREATENNNFDAIIESEYRGIGDDFSRQFYLYICCFYQHGALLRDSLLADLLGNPLPELYKRTETSTEGIISYECIDANKGYYAARARHHKIAAVVWERCGEVAQKESIILKIINSLNLNYGIDAHAFELLVRSDRIVDCLRRLEDRIAFFDFASKKDPTSPYVRQHYARMLSRSGQHQLALTQIENAIRNDQTVRVLFHTKGKILSELALSADSIEIGRKYLIQAESCFNRGISMSDRDEYNFESLASLYFEWSRRLQDKESSEATEYLSKAEEIISLGLRTVRNRESLWVLSSKIQNYLGNTPESIASLETAVRERSGCVVARFVLARAYREKGQPEEALRVLEPIIKSNSDEFRAIIQYSLALLESGESYKNAAAVLELGSLYGLSDPRFIATYGGVLFLDGEFTRADTVFENSVKRAIPADEMYAIHFKPFDSQEPSRPFTLSAEVISVKPGYSILQPDHYPKIICQASKYRGTLMKRGIKVHFSLVFSAKGPVALHPVLLDP